MNIHEYMAARIGLSQIYAEDGAFHSAARVLTELAEKVKEHAVWGDAVLNELASRVPEGECPGHVASIVSPKVCGRCGTHIDSLRPNDDELVDPSRKGAIEAQHRHRATQPSDVINLQGSGPAPIEPREG